MKIMDTTTNILVEMIFSKATVRKIPRFTTWVRGVRAKVVKGRAVKDSRELAGIAEKLATQCGTAQIPYKIALWVKVRVTNLSPHTEAKDMEEVQPKVIDPRTPDTQKVAISHGLTGLKEEARLEV